MEFGSETLMDDQDALKLVVVCASVPSHVLRVVRCLNL